MHLRRSLLCVLPLLAWIGVTAEAATRWVSPCGNDSWAGVSNVCSAPLGPKRTIQAAINVAVAGDVINVMPGVYHERIDLDGKAISLIGIGGAAATTIDGDGDGPVVTCNSLEGPATVIQGFTITDGATAGHGGGVFLALSAPTINGCVIAGNEATGSGGGLYGISASPTIIGCTFSGNAALRGGGAFFRFGAPTLTNCAFTGCDASLSGGGLMLEDNANATMTGGSISANAATTGGGLDASLGTVTLSHVAIAGNQATDFGGGVAFHLMDDATVEDCTFTGNVMDLGGHSAGGAMSIAACAVTVSDCDFDQNAALFGGGAIVCDDADGTSFSGCTFTGNENQGCCGASAVQAEDSTLSFFGCSFAANSVSQYGGAITMIAGDLTLTLCGFRNNLAMDTIAYGAALNLFDSSLQAGLCTFVGNQAGAGHGGGGGAVAGWDCNATFEGCAFEDNATLGSGVGGAIRMERCALVLDGCTLTGNDAGTGGAAYLLEMSGVDIVDTTFDGNAATGDGGAVYMEDGPITVRSGVFENNDAGNAGGGLFTAGMLITPNADHPLDLLNTEFRGNHAGVAGGGLCAGTPTSLVGCAFVDNAAHDGGGLVAVGTFADVKLYSCRLESNEVTGTGSALVVGAMTSGSRAMLVNCIVCCNTSPFGGGAVMETALGGHLDLINSVVADNTGGGIRINNGATSSTVSNTIVWGNTGGAELIGLAPTVRYSDVEGGAPGVGNLDVVPGFINAAAGNYGLAAGSPCIDAGLNWALPADVQDLDGDGDMTELIPLDFDHQPRFADVAAVADTGCHGPVIVDIGPYERSGSAVEDVRRGDLNMDGTVNSVDLAQMLGTWGACAAACCPADLNGDGLINGADLAILLANWG